MAQQPGPNSNFSSSPDNPTLSDIKFGLDEHLGIDHPGKSDSNRRAEKTLVIKS